jgi:MFS family permease
MFVAGLAIFTVASLGCGLSTSMPALLAARAVQGVGAAALAPAALALLTAVSPGGRAIGVWTAASAGGGASGWVAGGLLAGGPGWPWVFLVNVPIGIATIVAALAYVPNRAVSRGGSGIGVAGAMTVTGGIGLVLLGLSGIGDGDFGNPMPWLAVSVGVALLIAFRRAGMRGEIWRVRGFVAANAVALTLTAVTTGPIFLCVLAVSATSSPLQSGLTFAPFNVAVIVGSMVGGRLVRRLETRSMMAAGLAVIALANAGIAAALWLHWPILVAGLIVSGLGLGGAAVASTTLGLAVAPPAEHGVAAGVLNASAQLGSALGLGVLVSLANLASAPIAVAVAVLACLFVSGTVPRIPRVTDSPPSRGGDGFLGRDGDPAMSENP